MHLARHPKTASRLAYKLAVRFIGEHIKPTDAVVANAAAAYTNNDTAITPMVRSLLTSAEFRASAGRKVRRPIEYLAACMRGAQLQFDPAKAPNLVWAVSSSLGLLGQEPYSLAGPQRLSRQQRQVALGRGDGVALEHGVVRRRSGFWFGAPTFDIARIVGPTPPATVGEAVDRLASAVLCTPLDPASRAAIITATGLAESAPWKSWYNPAACSPTSSSPP